MAVPIELAHDGVVSIRVPLVMRRHVDLGRVWSAGCPGR
jgi:hypothetical protein